MTTTQEKQARVRILRLAGADPGHRPQRSIDRELAALLGKPAKASRSGDAEFRSYLDARGERHWKDAAGREVRYADLPAALRAAEYGGTIRFATSWAPSVR